MLKKLLKPLVSFAVTALLVMNIASCGKPLPPSQSTEDGSRTDYSSTPESLTGVEGDSEVTSEPVESGADADVNVDFTATDTDMFTDRDYRTEYDSTPAVDITLGGTSITANSANVSVEGAVATIKDDGTYVLRGTLTNGMIIVDAGESAKPQLVLDGASITGSTGAPIYIKSANKVFITLAEGSNNTLSNGGSFTQTDDNNVDGVIYSKTDLTINGQGALTLSSPAGHGVVCKDDLAITGGTYNITTASHGIDANDSVRICGGVFEAYCGKDGIHVENSEDATEGYVYISGGDFKIEAQGDGISGAVYVQIKDGTFDINAGGGSGNASAGGYGGYMGSYGGNTDSDSTSTKGIKVTGAMLISGGSFKINSADDALHANGNLTVENGEFEISTGDDGAHADETLIVSGGKISVTKSYEGLEALHVQVSGGEISLIASDDGINAAGGVDNSGTGGAFGNDYFGGGRPGGRPGGGGKPGDGGMSSGNGSIVISGGSLYVQASGDGIDANGTLEIKGGYTVVCGPTRGDTATLDYDRSATISGGTFIGTGASGGMAQSFSASPQGVISVSLGNQSAGTKLSVSDPSGKELINHCPELDYALLIFSSPEVVSGTSYTINVGSSNGTAQAR